MPKVAHCIAGQSRTVGHPMIYQNYEAHVLSKIEVRSDTFFATDKNNSGIDAFSPKAIHFEERVSNQYERWGHCMKLIEEEEASSGTLYSHVIISRPDLVVLQNIPSVDDFPKKSIWLRYSYPEKVAEYPSTMNVGDENAEKVTPGGGLSDLFHVIPRSMAKPFIDTMAQAPSQCGKVARNKVVRLTPRVWYQVQSGYPRFSFCPTKLPSTYSPRSYRQLWWRRRSQIQPLLHLIRQRLSRVSPS